MWMATKKFFHWGELPITTIPAEADSIKSYIVTPEHKAKWDWVVLR